MSYSVKLNSIPLLEGIDSQTKSFLEKKMRLVAYSKHSTVVMDGDDSHDLFFLIKGGLSVLSISAKGEMVLLASVAEGEHFGELSVLGEAPRSATVKANTDSLVAILRQKDALGLIAMSPLVAMRIMKKMAQVIRRNNELRSMYTIRSTPKRIYHYILNESKEAQNGERVVRGWPKQSELASLLNISRESVSRAMSKLIKEGVIKKMPDKIVIIAPEKLQGLVEEE